MTTLKPGDEVRVFRGRYRDDPEGGRPGKVTKAGRKWGTAVYEEEVHDWRGNTKRQERTVEFSLETGVERGGYGMAGVEVKTPERLEHERRSVAAVHTLRAAGIRFDGIPYRNMELLEALAAVVETFGQEGETGG